MGAALVFHGLCLNVVKNDGTCELVIPHTKMAGMPDDMHVYGIRSPADNAWTPFAKTFPDGAMTVAGLVSRAVSRVLCKHDFLFIGIFAFSRQDPAASARASGS